MDHSLLRGHETHPTTVDPGILWGIQTCPKHICLKKKSYIVGCLVFIVLPPTLFQCLCCVSHEEIPSEEGLESAFILIPSQLQIFNNILDHSFLHVLVSHRSLFWI